MPLSGGDVSRWSVYVLGREADADGVEVLVRGVAALVSMRTSRRGVLE